MLYGIARVERSGNMGDREVLLVMREWTLIIMCLLCAKTPVTTMRLYRIFAMDTVASTFTSRCATELSTTISRHATKSTYTKV